MNLSGIITGIVLTVGGIALLGIAALLILQSASFVWLLLYGLIALCLGLYILFHLRQEDEIEKVNYKKQKRDKKS